jgi:hypothetical protein
MNWLIPSRLPDDKLTEQPVVPIKESVIMGITPMQEKTLNAVYAGCLTAGEVSERLDITHQSAINFMNKLHRHGLLHKTVVGRTSFYSIVNYVVEPCHQ